MCKHCKNIEDMHFAMQIHKAKSSNTPEERIISRADFNGMDKAAVHVAGVFIREARSQKFDPNLISGFSFSLEQSALTYAYCFERPKDLEVQLELIKQVESLRAALTLVQSRLVLTDNDTLKTVIEDALVTNNPKVNSADLAKDIADIKAKAAHAKAEDF